MNKRFLLLLTPLLFAATLRAQSPIVLSVADLLPNYGLDSTYVRDSASAIAHLDAQQQNYGTLATLCVQLRNSAQQALSSLESDYRRDDTLLWIDTHIVVNDLDRYAPRLRAFADLMGRRSIHYSRLEQQRLEAEKEAARQRAIEQQRMQQEERNAQATTLKQGIDRRHRAILSACNGEGITDKLKLKDLKDLYYSYLMVYNKYDLSASNASARTLDQLQELNTFQLDVLDNLLAENSLTSQIDNFKNQLKARCEKDNSDVYRSYSRVFKNTTVPVSFADLKEYEDYIQRLRSIIAVQQRYMQTIDLRTAISRNSDEIQRLYGKKYRDFVNTYRETLRTLNLLPAFTTGPESVSFVSELQDFVDAQQVYIDSYPAIEGISLRSDSIIAASQSTLRDVAAAYRELRPSLLPPPTYKTPAEAQRYLERLDRVRHMQQLYVQTIEIRNDLRRLDDSITARRRDDRILWSGYCVLRKNASLTPTFALPEHGEQFVAGLDLHRRMLQTTLQIQQIARSINANENRITGKGNSFRNIAKAYQRLEKDYLVVTDIHSLDDLGAYHRQSTSLLAMQQAFLKLLASDLATDADLKLRNEQDLSKIRLVLGLK